MTTISMNEEIQLVKQRQQRNGESGRVEGERSRLDELLVEVPHCYVKEVLVRLGEHCCP